MASQRQKVATAREQLLKQKESLPNITSQRALRDKFKGIRGLVQRKNVKTAEDIIGNRLGIVKGYEQQLTDYEVGTLLPVEAKVNEYEQRKASIDEAQKAYERGLDIKSDFQNPYTKEYLRNMYKLEGDPTERFLENVEEIKSQLPEGDKLLVDYKNMRIKGVESGSLGQSFGSTLTGEDKSALDKYNKAIQKLSSDVMNPPEIKNILLDQSRLSLIERDIKKVNEMKNVITSKSIFSGDLFPVVSAKSTETKSEPTVFDVAPSWLDRTKAYFKSDLSRSGNVVQAGLNTIGATAQTQYDKYVQKTGDYYQYEGMQNLLGFAPNTVYFTEAAPLLLVAGGVSKLTSYAIKPSILSNKAETLKTFTGQNLGINIPTGLSKGLVVAYDVGEGALGFIGLKGQVGRLKGFSEKETTIINRLTSNQKNFINVEKGGKVTDIKAGSKTTSPSLRLYSRQLNTKGLTGEELAAAKKYNKIISTNIYQYSVPEGDQLKAIELMQVKEGRFFPKTKSTTLGYTTGEVKEGTLNAQRYLITETTKPSTTEFAYELITGEGNVRYTPNILFRTESSKGTVTRLFSKTYDKSGKVLSLETNPLSFASNSMIASKLNKFGTLSIETPQVELKNALGFKEYKDISGFSSGASIFSKNKKGISKVVNNLNYPEYNQFTILSKTEIPTVLPTSPTKTILSSAKSNLGSPFGGIALVSAQEVTQPSTYAGTGQYELTQPTTQVNLFSTKETSPQKNIITGLTISPSTSGEVSTIQKSNLNIVSKTEVKPSTSIKEKQKVTQETGVNVLGDVKTASLSLFKTQPKQRQETGIINILKPSQRTGQKSRQTTTTTQKSPQPSKSSSKIPTPFLDLLKSSAGKSKNQKEKQSQDLVEVFGRRFGKDFSLGKFKKEKAEQVLDKFLKSSLARSGFLSVGGEKVKSDLFNLGTYRPSKADPFRVVQKAKYSLSSGGEKSEIQFFKKKSSSKKKKRFKWF